LILRSCCTSCSSGVGWSSATVSKSAVRDRLAATCWAGAGLVPLLRLSPGVSTSLSSSGRLGAPAVAGESDLVMSLSIAANVDVSDFNVDENMQLPDYRLLA